MQIRDGANMDHTSHTNTRSDKTPEITTAVAMTQKINPQQSKSGLVWAMDTSHGLMH